MPKQGARISNKIGGINQQLSINRINDNLTFANSKDRHSDCKRNHDVNHNILQSKIGHLTIRMLC